MSDQRDEILQALRKRALGYTVTEQTEEYCCDDNGSLVLTKRKISVKDVPPELSAIKLLLET